MLYSCMKLFLQINFLGHQVGTQIAQKVIQFDLITCNVEGFCIYIKYFYLGTCYTARATDETIWIKCQTDISIVKEEVTLQHILKKVSLFRT